MIYLQKSNSDKKLHNKKGYSFKIIKKTTLQKSYIHRKNYKYKNIRYFIAFNYVSMYITQYKLSFHWYFGNNIFIGIKSTWISLVFLRTVFYSYLLDLCTHKISWAHEPLIIEEIVKLSKSHFKRFTSSWNSSFTFSCIEIIQSQIIIIKAMKKAN